MPNPPFFDKHTTLSLYSEYMIYLLLCCIWWVSFFFATSVWSKHPRTHSDNSRTCMCLIKKVQDYLQFVLNYSNP